MRILIEGEDAEAAAGELAEALQEVFGHETAPRAIRADEAEGEEKIEAGTVIGIIALVMSIPSTLLAIRSLMERPEKKKRADELMERLRELEKRFPSTTIRLRGVDGATVRIRKVDGNRLIDIASGSGS